MGKSWRWLWTEDGRKEAVLSHLLFLKSSRKESTEEGRFKSFRWASVELFCPRPTKVEQSTNWNERGGRGEYSHCGHCREIAHLIGEQRPISPNQVVYGYYPVCVFVCVWRDVWAEERKQLKWCCWGAAAQMMTKRDDNQGCCLALDLPCSTTIPLRTMVSARKWRCSGGSLWPQTDAKWTEEAIKPENIPQPISVRRCWQMD